MNTSRPERAPIAGAISFTHRLTPAREEYTGTDTTGRDWIIFRHLRGGGNITREWFVLVVLPNQTVRVLNTSIGVPDDGYDEVGVLYDLDATDVHRLLAAVEQLIHTGATLDPIRRPRPAGTPGDRPSRRPA